MRFIIITSETFTRKAKIDHALSGDVALEQGIEDLDAMKRKG